MLVNLSAMRVDTRCHICFNIVRNCRTVVACLHRFCAKCIERSMRVNRSECPACRAHLPSRRFMREDPNFDRLMVLLYGDLDEDQAREEAHTQAETDEFRKVTLDGRRAVRIVSDD